MVIIKNKKEISVIKAGGKILSRVLDEVCEMVKPGVSTDQLEETAVSLISRAGGRPAFKGYKSLPDDEAFPTALCTSINDEVVHAPAIPGRRLNSGDIVGIDIGMEYPWSQTQTGYFTDMSRTVAVGKVAQEAKELMKTTKKALMLAIEQVKPGNTLNDIGSAVQKCAEGAGFSVVRDLVGHGVGKAVHEDPQIPNYRILGTNFENVELKPGMVIAIEPMINLGGYKVKILPDGFTIATADGQLSAHFEHTIAVTEKGHEIMTI